MDAMKCALAFTIIAQAMLGLSAATIEWQGYTWNVKDGYGMGPGPNTWSSSNVWVDESGFLHLKIENTGSGWTCAELGTTQRLGFGTYQVQAIGRIDLLDPNVIFAMFHYSGPDGQKEIDIEYAQWGYPGNINGNVYWTIYPNDASIPGTHTTTNSFRVDLSGTYTTSRYTWLPHQIEYKMLGGHQPITSDVNIIRQWTATPENPQFNIPQEPMSLIFNLWLYKGRAPMNGQPVEVVLAGFTKI